MQRKDFEKMSEAYYQWEKKTDNKHPSSAFKAGYESAMDVIDMQEKLRVATEALEEIVMEESDYLPIAWEALAKIKEQA